MSEDATLKPSVARRRLLLGVAAGLSTAFVTSRFGGSRANAASPATFEVTHSDAEWRALLTPEQSTVLRQEGTERPFTSPLDREKRKGTFSCAGCANDL